jgi:hypothetical protein
MMCRGGTAIRNTGLSSQHFHPTTKTILSEAEEAESRYRLPVPEALKLLLEVLYCKFLKRTVDRRKRFRTTRTYVHLHFHHTEGERSKKENHKK